MKRIGIFLLLACLSAGLYAQTAKKESLALLPFTGGGEGEGEYIVSEFARQRVLRDAFNRVTLVTPTTVAVMQFEHKFQRDSGLTDADSIFELGKKLNAAYVVAGYIAKLGDRNLVLVSILDVERLQQVAGDYRPYKDIEEVDTVIPGMARKLAALVQRDTSNLPGLSVPPFEMSGEVNANDSQVLAQILACELANGSKYAVLPRTDSLQKVLEEHERQRTGETDQERIKRLGVGRNAKFVLSGSVGRLGRLNRFAADILNIEDGSFIDGYSERYGAFPEGIDLMPKLAAGLNGTPAQAAAPAADPVPGGFVRIPGGTFTMGSPASEPGRGSGEVQHQVTVSGFYMGKYEVTQKEWVEVMGNNPSNFKGDTLPVERVSWYDVIDYCNRRSVKEGLTPAYTIDKGRSDPNNTGSNDTIKWIVTWNRSANGYRLPTEAEWEYACRAGTTTAYSTGSNAESLAGYANVADLTAKAKYSDWSIVNIRDGYAETAPVGSFKSNARGLYDMHGNVWEWCWDWYGSYSSGAQTDPTGASSGSTRVLRGGSWGYPAGYVRSANRHVHSLLPELPSWLPSCPPRFIGRSSRGRKMPGRRGAASDEPPEGGTEKGMKRF